MQVHAYVGVFWCQHISKTITVRFETLYGHIHVQKINSKQFTSTHILKMIHVIKRKQRPRVAPRGCVRHSHTQHTGKAEQSHQALHRLSVRRSCCSRSYGVVARSVFATMWAFLHSYGYLLALITFTLMLDFLQL